MSNAQQLVAKLWNYCNVLRDDGLSYYNPANRHERVESERFRVFPYDDLVKRDKANLDLFWLKDDSLEDSANLPPPDELAAEIVEDLEAALAQFSLIAGDLAQRSDAMI